MANYPNGYVEASLIDNTTIPLTSTDSTPPPIDWSNSDIPEKNGYNIRTSSAYKTAYSIFSQLSDKQWLNRLEVICSSSAVGDPSVGDILGFTQDYQKRQLEAYNNQVAEIQNLLADYYKHVNSLPITQVQQAADAGVNLAVMGNVGASSLDYSPSSRSSLSGEGTNMTDFILGTVSAVSNVVGTVSSVIKSVADTRNTRRGLSIQESSFLSSMWKSLSDSGFDIGGQPFQTFDDLNSWIGANSTDPEIMRRFNESLSDLISSDVQFAPYRSAFVDDHGDFNYDHNKLRSFLQGSMNVDSVAEVDAGLALIADFQMQSMLLDKMTSYYQSVYNEAMSSGLDGHLSASAANIENSRVTTEGELSILRSSLQSDFIRDFGDQWNKSKSPEARYALLAELTNLDLDDQVMLELIEHVGSPSLAKGINKLIDTTSEGVSELFDTVSTIFRRKPKVPRKPKVKK